MIKTFFANFLYQIASLVVVVLVIGGAIWAYAAFTEPSAAPSASNQDFAQNILGADNANNSFASTNVAANADGSVIERLEHLWAQLSPKLSNIDATISSRALDSEIGNADDAANMGTTLFAGQQYLWDNRASFGASGSRGCFNTYCSCSPTGSNEYGENCTCTPPACPTGYSSIGLNGMYSTAYWMRSDGAWFYNRNNSRWCCVQ